MGTQNLLRRITSLFHSDPPRAASTSGRAGASLEPGRGVTMHRGTPLAPHDTHDRKARETSPNKALISPRDFAAVSLAAKASRDAEKTARADAAIDHFVERAAHVIESVTAARARLLEDPSRLPDGIRLSVENFDRHEECHYAMASYLLPKAQARLEERLRRTLGPSASFRFMATREWYATSDESKPAYGLTVSLVGVERIEARAAHAEHARRVREAADALADSVMTRLDSELRRAAARGDDATVPLSMFTLVPTTMNVMSEWVQRRDAVPVIATTIHGRCVERLNVPWNATVQHALEKALRARLADTPYDLDRIITSTVWGSGDVSVALTPR